MLIRLLSVLLFLLPALALAKDPVVGMYGVSMPPGIESGGRAANLKNDGVNAVFVPPDRKIIEYFTAQHFKVYLTLNVFGGREPWKEFPDSIPVTADGTKLVDSYGGICPTHPEWRKSRLQLLNQWLVELGGDKGISGIWLDFIRYPGRWEHADPSLPDSCYCPRCLTLFQAENGVQLPSGLSTAESAAWIKTNAHIKWDDWKKEQIVSFVRDARRLVDQYSKDRELLLGAFLVPWKKSDQNGAVSFRLAQDSQLLAPYLDVLSPMVYHKMVGESVSWIGATTDYFVETGVSVWPIIQAEDVGKGELRQVIQGLNESNSDGMLIYTFRHMTDDQWPLLKDYTSKENHIPNPQLESDKSGGGISSANSAENPRDWFRPSFSSIEDSTFWFDKLDSKNNSAIGLTAGQDRQANWTTGLQSCVPGEEYQFSADFYRRDRSDAPAYPEISVWGQEYRLNTHRVVNNWQKLKARVVCPDIIPEKNMFQFENSYPGTTFWMRSPQLILARLSDRGLPREPVKTNFFPIGAYGANEKNLKELKEVGLNTAVVAMTQENIEQCLELNMRCTLSVPRSPEKLFIALEKYSPLIELGNFAYYVNDEPGIHSFSESTARDIYDIIKQRLPNAVTNMAIVRPQAIPYYEQGADFFMLDQYPVPSMPMTWLSDSMDEAAKYVGRNRLQSIIQAFGGGQFASSGWPRLPTFEEMNCLAYLSVIHGSRGIYFYTYPSITSTEQGKEDFTRLIRRLNSVRSWLQVVNDEEPVKLKMTSKYSVDPKGNAAVHCVRKEQLSTQMLICVNTINTYTEAEVAVSKDRSPAWVGYYSGTAHRVVDGTILSRFNPYEVKVLLEEK
ncbi:MAG: hypothetical protein ACI8ZB_000712 [Desulforhopalus sp.]|jgi:hypothetical protein